MRGSMCAQPAHTHTHTHTHMRRDNERPQQARATGAPAPTTSVRGAPRWGGGLTHNLKFDAFLTTLRAVRTETLCAARRAGRSWPRAPRESALRGRGHAAQVGGAAPYVPVASARSPAAPKKMAWLTTRAACQVRRRLCSGVRCERGAAAARRAQPPPARGARRTSLSLPRAAAAS